MATLRKHPKSHYWYACLRLPNGKRTNRSTGIPHTGAGINYEKLQKELASILKADVTIKPKAGVTSISALDARRQAERIANKFEDAAAEASAGRFRPDRARETIREIYALANAEPLPESTTAAFLDAWLKRKEVEASGGTHERYENVVTRFKEFLGAKAGRDILNVTAADIAKFRDKQAATLSRATVNLSVKILRTAFGDAKRDALVTVNEAERVSILRQRDLFERRAERRAFTLDELKAILKAANEEWRGMILTGLYTGQRLGDIATLTWLNVDLQAGELRLLTEKTSRRQIVPLAEPLMRHLQKLPTSDDPAAPLFPKAYALMEASGRTSPLSAQFYAILVAANLAKKRPPHRAGKGKGKGKNANRDVSAISFHCLRHTATSLLKTAGVSDSVAMEFVGHESASVSRQYTHIPTQALREAAAKLPDVTSSDKGGENGAN